MTEESGMKHTTEFLLKVAMTSGQQDGLVAKVESHEQHAPRGQCGRRTAQVSDRELQHTAASLASLLTRTLQK